LTGSAACRLRGTSASAPCLFAQGAKLASGGTLGKRPAYTRRTFGIFRSFESQPYACSFEFCFSLEKKQGET
jgi:hypothetical protein